MQPMQVEQQICGLCLGDRLCVCGGVRGMVLQDAKMSHSVDLRGRIRSNDRCSKEDFVFETGLEVRDATCRSVMHYVVRG